MSTLVIKRLPGEEGGLPMLEEQESARVFDAFTNPSKEGRRVSPKALERSQGGLGPRRYVTSIPRSRVWGKAGILGKPGDNSEKIRGNAEDRSRLATRDDPTARLVGAGIGVIGGTALAAGGSAAYLHHQKKKKKLAQQQVAKNWFADRKADYDASNRQNDKPTQLNFEAETLGVNSRLGRAHHIFHGLGEERHGGGQALGLNKDGAGTRRTFGRIGRALQGSKDEAVKQAAITGGTIVGGTALALGGAAAIKHGLDKKKRRNLNNGEEIQKEYSAEQNRKNRLKRNIAIGVGTAAAVGAGAYAYHKYAPKKDSTEGGSTERGSKKDPYKGTGRQARSIHRSLNHSVRESNKDTSSPKPSEDSPKPSTERFFTGPTPTETRIPLSNTTLTIKEGKMTKKTVRASGKVSKMNTYSAIEILKNHTPAAQGAKKGAKKGAKIGAAIGGAAGGINGAVLGSFANGLDEESGRPSSKIGNAANVLGMGAVGALAGGVAGAVPGAALGAGIGGVRGKYARGKHPNSHKHNTHKVAKSSAQSKGILEIPGQSSASRQARLAYFAASSTY